MNVRDKKTSRTPGRPPAAVPRSHMSLFHRVLRQIPLSLKIAIPLVVITVATSALLGFYATHSANRELRAAYQAQLGQIETAVQSVFAASPNDSKLMNNLLARIKDSDSLVYVAQVYRDGSPPTLWASTSGLDVGRRAKPAETKTIRSGTETQRTFSVAGIAIQESDIPLSTNGKVVASLALSTRLAPLISSTSATAQRSELVVLAAVILQVVALALVLYWAVLKRVARLGRAAALVANGYLAIRLPEADEPRGRDAVANVGREFDRMLRAVQARTRQQAAVAALGQRALVERDLGKLLGEAGRLISQALEARFSMILEIAPDRSGLQLRSGEGWQDGVVGTATVPLAPGSQAAYTLSSKLPVVSEDLLAEARFEVAHLLRDHGTVGCATVVIGGENGQIGILGAASAVPRLFSDEDVNFLQSVANAVAEAIQRARTTQALFGSEARTGAILQAALDSILTMDDNGGITEFNPAAERSFGYLRAEVIGKNIVELVELPAVGEGHPPGLSGYLSRGRGVHLGERTELNAKRNDGREFPVEITITRVPAEGPPLYTAFLRDITERKQAEEQIAFMAYHDKLTHLPNRAMFEEHLELALARARRNDHAVAVLYMDLDNFKLVNDSLGHEAGDELLSQMADRLRDVTRDTDLVARQGGDEFLLLFADIERPEEGVDQDAVQFAIASAERVAERIKSALSTPFQLADTEFYVSASMGISVFPIDAQDSAQLLRNADSAMYRSKRLGPGNYALYSGEASDNVNRLSFTTRLRRAVDERHWVLHYQPILDLKSGEMVEVEALIRWLDPNGGLVAPGEFIPLAEEMGLIGAIGDWVLTEVCRQSKEWTEQGIDLRIGFNLSPRQLWQPDLGLRVLQRMQASGVDPANVTVEITESAAMSDPDRTQRVLADLHGHGLHLAIDDFGTGYSSLSRLKYLPVDVLKIDRSFVRDIPRDADASSIVRAIIQLGQSLGMTPLAEGIETEEQWKFLVDQGCTLGQGYLFSRPVPAEEIAARFQRKPLRLVPDAQAGEILDATNG